MNLYTRNFADAAEIFLKEQKFHSRTMPMWNSQKSQLGKLVLNLWKAIQAGIN